MLKTPFHLLLIDRTQAFLLQNKFHGRDASQVYNNSKYSLVTGWFSIVVFSGSALREEVECYLASSIYLSKIFTGLLLNRLSNRVGKRWGSRLVFWKIGNDFITQAWYYHGGVISVMHSEITVSSTVCLEVCSGCQQKTHQISALLAIFEENPPVSWWLP